MTARRTIVLSAALLVLINVSGDSNAAADVPRPVVGATSAPVFTQVDIKDVVGAASAISVSASDVTGVVGYDWTLCDINSCSAHPWHSHAITVGGGHPDGPLVVEVTASNAVGGRTAISRTIGFDATPPVVDVVSPAPGTDVHSSAVPIRFDAHDLNLVGTECAVDGGERSPCESGWLATGLTVGSSHVIAVHAIDAGDNRFERDIVVDATPARLVVTTLGPLTWAGGTVVVGGLPAGAMGSVKVTDHATGTSVCRASIAANGAAVCAAAPHSLQLGVHRLDASYSGDGTVFAANGYGDTSVLLASVPAGVRTTDGSFGHAHPIALTGLPNDATGTVTFSTRAVVLCRARVQAGRASCSASATLRPGVHLVTAAYSGDAHYAPSTAERTVSISRGRTALRFVAGRRTVPKGKTLTMRLGGLPATASGSVTVSVGRRILCRAQVSRGLAVCRTPRSLRAGRYNARASYAGNSVWSSSATTVRFVVVAPLRHR